jgi:hypothetical protein
LEIADFADRHGIPRRTFVRDLIRATNGDVSEDLVLVLVRRIRRQRAKARASSKK